MRPYEKVLGILTFVVGVALLFAWPVAFWVMLAMGLAASMWFAFVLSRVPRLSLPGLSPGAQLLLDEYNHAFSAPGLTRLTRTCLNAGGLVCLVAAVRYAFSGNWVIAAEVLIPFAVFSYLSGKFDPAGFIRKENLYDESRELAAAYAAMMTNRRQGESG